MKFTTRTYVIGSHFLPALINGDYTGLEDHEERELDVFLDAVGCKGHWDYAEAGFTRCEITGLMDDCYEVTAFDPIP